jgi:hypothetical protein
MREAIQQEFFALSLERFPLHITPYSCFSHTNNDRFTVPYFAHICLTAHGRRGV